VDKILPSGPYITGRFDDWSPICRDSAVPVSKRSRVDAAAAAAVVVVVECHSMVRY